MSQRPSTSGAEKGFTLIELLIVIVVLGILSAIVLFAVGSTRDDAVASSCKAERVTIQTAQEAYKAKYAGGYAGLSADTPPYGPWSNLAPEFMKAAPTNFTMTGGGATYWLVPVAPCTEANSVLAAGSGGSGGSGGGGGGGGTTTTTTSTSTTTTSTTLPPALTISCSVGNGSNRDNITCGGGGAAAGSTVTITICRSSTFPCPGGNTAATLNDTANGSGAYNDTSGNLSDNTYFIRAVQGSRVSPVVTQVVND